MMEAFVGGFIDWLRRGYGVEWKEGGREWGRVLVTVKMFQMFQMFLWSNQGGSYWKFIFLFLFVCQFVLCP